MVLRISILLLLVAKSYGFYADSSTIVTLDSSNFEQLVKNSEEIWLVEFFTPDCGNCQHFASEYQKAANVLEGIVKVGAVDGDDNPTLAQENDVLEYPTVKIFSLQEGLVEEYVGEYTAKALLSYLSEAIQSKIDSHLDADIFKNKATVELTEDNFDYLVLEPQQMWLVVYYSPFSEKCEKLSTHWTALTNDLKGMIKLGALDATFDFAKAFDCKAEEYPSIQFFSLGQKTVTSGITYSGAYSSEEIVHWALENIADNAPAPATTQIVDFDSLKTACEHKRICVVSILPHISDCQSKCRKEHLETLNKAGEKYRRALWGWVWSEAKAQPGVENALKLDDFGYPVMAAVNVKKMKYSVLTAPLSFDKIDEFLQDVSYRRGDSKRIVAKQFPEIRKIAPWNGLDATLPSNEEITGLPHMKVGSNEVKEEL